METGGSGGRAMAFDGETVYSGSATGILDGQPEARGSIMEIRTEGRGGGGTGSSVVESSE